MTTLQPNIQSMYLFRRCRMDNPVVFCQCVVVSFSMDHLIIKIIKTHTSSIYIFSHNMNATIIRSYNTAQSLRMSLTINVILRAMLPCIHANKFTSTLETHNIIKRNTSFVFGLCSDVTSAKGHLNSVYAARFSEYAVTANNALFQHVPSLLCGICISIFLYMYTCDTFT